MRLHHWSGPGSIVLLLASVFVLGTGCPLSPPQPPPSPSQVDPPTIGPQTAGFVDSVEVTLSAANADATILYTLDGTDPQAGSALTYAGPFTLTENTTVKARATKANSDPSDVVAMQYGVIGTTRWFLPNYGLPAVGQDGRLYSLVTVQDGESETHALAAATADGQELWRVALDAAPAEGGPVVGPNGTVYVTVKADKLLAYASDGTLKWQLPVENWLANPVDEPWRAIYPSLPAVDADGNVYFVSGNSVLFAVDSDGNVRWSQTITGVEDPIIGPDGTVHVAGTDELYAFDSDGSAAATFPLQPVAFDGNGGVRGFDNPDSMVHALVAYDADGTELWRHAEEICSGPSGCAYGRPDNVSIGPDANTYASFFRSAGASPEVTHFVSVTPDGTASVFDGGIYPGAPLTIAADGTVYTLTFTYGNTYRLEANAAGGEARWTIDGTGLARGLNIGTDGTVYYHLASTESGLTAVFGDSPLAQAAWPMQRGGPGLANRPSASFVQVTTLFD